jgi:2-methylfumaryl-CoA hydratase
MFDTHQPGPMYEDFVVGVSLPPLPSITLTDADNSLYRAITGDQHGLTADTAAYRKVSGSTGALANPGLVMQCSIGQTTMATRRAIANLYYRSVRVLRPVEIGETLSTTTTVLGLRDSTPKDGQVRGKVWLGIDSSTERGAVASYERCALVRGRGNAQPGHDDNIPGPPDPTALAEIAGSTPRWDVSKLDMTDWRVGDARTDPLRDHIDLAAPLARMTFNQAAVHRDHMLTANGRRLVFGGHVQGLAQASLTRMMPGLALVVAWDACNHLGPAHEGDLLEFEHLLDERCAAGTGHLSRFEVVGSALGPGSERTEILRWTPIVWGP